MRALFMMTDKLLTICIPSYGRLQKARRTIEYLLPQVTTNQCEILVLDNASPEPYEPAFKEEASLILAIEQGLLKISRHPTNIGMSGNFLRAFELSCSDWLWLMSDDDRVEPDALNQVMAAIHAANDVCGFIKFGSSSPNSQLPEETIDTFEDFIERNAASKDEFNDFIFISSGIYRLKDFLKYLEVGYLHAHTYIPHFMMLAAFMANGGQLALKGRALVKYTAPRIGYSYGLLAGLGVGGTKSLLFNVSPEHVRRFYALFFPHHDFKVVIDLYFQCKKKANSEVYKYHVRNYVYLVSLARGSIRIWLLRIFSELGRIPSAFEFLLRVMEARSSVIGKHLTEIKARYGFVDPAELE